MEIRIALAGNPNCGKTTLFNALTGSNQFVGNWPGVTVEKKEGKLKSRSDVIITDLPGIYSLSPYTLEEVVARNYLINERPDVILNIVDGTNLERNLYLTTQLMELGIPVVIAINMMDIVRKNGDRGIRNDIWIVPTVGCVNSIAKQLAEKTGAICFSHPYGCSQLGDDNKTTQLILRGLIKHPNAGGVLVLGLGCENNNIPEMQKVMGTWNENRVKFLSVQDCENELEHGIALINELKDLVIIDEDELELEV